MWTDHCRKVSFVQDGNGPLLATNHAPLPPSPFLRAREAHVGGVLQASWTAYQPTALLWDYAFWGGAKAFASLCNLSPTGRLPNLSWDSCLPKYWSERCSPHDKDAAVQGLLPPIRMYICAFAWSPCEKLNP